MYIGGLGRQVSFALGSKVKEQVLVGAGLQAAREPVPAGL